MHAGGRCARDSSFAAIALARCAEKRAEITPVRTVSKVCVTANRPTYCFEGWTRWPRGFRRFADQVSGASTAHPYGVRVRRRRFLFGYFTDLAQHDLGPSRLCERRSPNTSSDSTHNRRRRTGISKGSCHRPIPETRFGRGASTLGEPAFRASVGLAAPDDSACLRSARHAWVGGSQRIRGAGSGQPSSWEEEIR